jgi:hypothetical protein
MSFFPSPQLEELRARLSQVADAIFDRSARLHGSPFGRPGATTGADSRLLSLWRTWESGLGAAASRATLVES